MAWHFRNSRRSIKLLPGVRLNISPKGISSVSIGGGKGWFKTTINISRHGIRTTHSVKGVGSVSNYRKHRSRDQHSGDKR
ncbi:MAG: DUF4236 domain-containing protein [Cyanobacteria bacterium P01_G01_bin.54]